MLEVMIECWDNADGTADYLWSVWQAGRRVEMSGRFESVESAEQAARAYCRNSLGQEPQRVRML